MRLYEYLIGGKKTGRIGDLKDAIPGSKSFRELKEGETFFVSLFEVNGGTRIYTSEIKITSIVKERAYWAFSGFTKTGKKFVHHLEMKSLNKALYVEDQRTYYRVFSTFEMDDKTFFELAKKEIENSKNK